MDWKESSRARLPAHLDRNGDLVPPWQEFPTYERYCMGWRMGSGEDWLGLWHVFLESLATDYESRLAYLKRHRPAPVCWARSVLSVLRPGADADEYEEGVPNAVVGELLESGLLAIDAAFLTWQEKHREPRFPWNVASTPVEAARIYTREFWFSSRQCAALSDDQREVEVPGSWRLCADAFASRTTGDLDRDTGLLSLAFMLVAGDLKAPWQLGASLEEFTDSFDDDMGYVDAFRLWVMSAFDGEQEVERYLARTNPPPEWRDWLMEQAGYE